MCADSEVGFLYLECTRLDASYIFPARKLFISRTMPSSEKAQAGRARSG
jgi:hypothetical protein